VSRPKWQEEIIGEGELYRVGGAVRDELLGRTEICHDTDYLVRGMTPEALETILKRHGRVELVGKMFGVYKFVPAGGAEQYDIAFPRMEKSSGPGHRDFDVDWDWRLDVETDLGRRDFTINAMARDVRDDRLIDPHGGRRDLESGVVRMLFRNTFAEDPLRILRGVRFSVQLGMTIEECTRSEMKANVSLLDSLSAERVQEELTRILSGCEKPGDSFVLLREIGALAHILPELDRCAGVEQNEYHPHDVFVHSLRTCDCAPRDNLTVRWAALLHDVGKVDTRHTVEDEKLGERVVFYGHQNVSADVASAVLQRLRYANEFVSRCVNLIRFHMFNYEPGWKAATVRRFIRRVGEENLGDLFLLREADAKSRGRSDDLTGLSERIRAELEQRNAITLADLAVDGRDVMRECGIAAGPEIGRILSELLELVLEDPSLNDRDSLRARLQNMGKNS
jgi:poly(A) polymerase/tRNA nucleotidyltransferase (CCA-adding enzyme)